MKTMPDESGSDMVVEIGGIEMVPIPAKEIAGDLPEQPQVKFGMRRKGPRVDCKVVDVAGRPFCPPAEPHNLVLRYDTIILEDQRGGIWGSPYPCHRCPPLPRIKGQFTGMGCDSICQRSASTFRLRWETRCST
jgi:hypothetical protein